MSKNSIETWLESCDGVVEKYYDHIIARGNPRFSKYNFTSNNTVVCPLHDDNDPSLGVIKSKGRERFHCFGCGAWGNVVDLAIRVSREQGNREAVARKVAKDLAISIPESLEDGEAPDEIWSDLHPMTRRRAGIRRRMRSFGRDDIRRGIRAIRTRQERAGYLDTLLVRSIMESRKED